MEGIHWENTRNSEWRKEIKSKSVKRKILEKSEWETREKEWNQDVIDNIKFKKKDEVTRAWVKKKNKYISRYR